MARTISARAVLVGVYSALNVASMTAICTGGIHNGVPQSQTFPYLRTEAFGTPDDTMGRSGDRIVVRLHIFTRGATDDVALQILSKSRELLEYQAVSVSGHVLAGCKYEQSYQAGTENIGAVETRHLVAEFVAVTRSA